MSLPVRRSRQIAATLSIPTQEPIQATGTRNQPIRQSTGGRGPLRLANPRSQHLRLQSSAKRPQADPEEGDAVEGSVDDGDGSIADPGKVRWPIANLVSPALATAWKVYPKQKMCFIFDPVSTAHQFKQGMLYDEDSDFPRDTLDGDITETDGPGAGWMPVAPTLVRCVWKHSTPWRQTNSPWHIGTDTASNAQSQHQNSWTGRTRPSGRLRLQR